MTRNDFQQMSETNINTIDKNNLTDIKNIIIDAEESYMDRLTSFVEQMKNPFCFLCDGIVVKVNYASNGKTLDETVIEHFSKYKN